MDNQIEAEILAVKTLRRNIDISIQQVKDLKPSRERALAITKLQEGVMWLGMDLKRISEENPQPKPTPADLARAAYLRYGEVTEFKNFRGEQMPHWDDLTQTIQLAWIAAADSRYPIANPYPNSKDPSNTVIDPTADGLKL